MWKKHKGLIILGIVVLVILMSFGSCKNTYNSMVELQETYKNKWAEVDNQLKRRYDLIPNLVNTVKGYAKHEKEVFKNIADARAKLAGAGSVRAKVNAANGMESAISRLLAVVENYPNLKASEQFRGLQDELAGTENRVAVARKRFNDAVTAYNKYIKKFPTVLYARILNFAEGELYKIGEEEKIVPKTGLSE